MNSILSTIIVTSILLVAPSSNQLESVKNLNTLDYDNLFSGKCSEIEDFSKSKINQIFDPDQCKYGELGSVRYTSGGINIADNHIVPIFMISPRNGNYNSTFIHMLGGPGDSIKMFNAPNYFQSMVKIANDDEATIIWIGYSGIFERSLLTANEIEITKYEAQEVIKILHRKLENINIIAISLGAYIYSSVSNNLPKTPVSFVSPLLGSPYELKQNTIRDYLSRELFLRAYLERWSYSVENKSLYGRDLKKLKATKLFNDYYGEYSKVDNYTMFNEKHFSCLNIIYSSRDDRIQPSKITSFKKHLDDSNIIDTKYNGHMPITSNKFISIIDDIYVDKSSCATLTR